MSASTKRKHVEREVRETVLPTADQFIVRVIGGCGNNLHEVERSPDNKFLASMPSKFRKNVWIKRGDFLLCSPIAEGGKVKAEIVAILYKDHIKHIKNSGMWPAEFGEETVCNQAGINLDDVYPSSECDSESATESDDSSALESKVVHSDPKL